MEIEKNEIKDEDHKRIKKLLFWLIWLIFDFTPIRFVLDKIIPESSNMSRWRLAITRTGAKPSSFLIWIFGIYVACYGFVETKHERDHTRALYARSDMLTRLNSQSIGLRESAVRDFVSVQSFRAWKEPDIICPVSWVFWCRSHWGEKDQPNLGIPFDLSGINLRGSNLKKSNLKGAILSSADLQGANLDEANLKNANLEGANLENASFVEANLEDANLFNSNLKNASLIQTNLVGANLNEADLKEAILSGEMEDADFSKANLKGAWLVGANLNRANLFEANLSGADLTGASLIEAQMQGAILSRIKILNTNFERAFRPENDVAGWRSDKDGRLQKEKKGKKIIGSP